MPVSRTRRPSAPPLALKAQPRQQRSQDTRERILATTAQLLGEVGIERLSTNLVCQRLGLTPPALYHYFPNKYAIVHELGARLMHAQDEVVAQWVTPRTMTLGPAAFKRALAGMLAQMFKTTREHPDGVWVLRALRAVPALQSLRLQSHERVTALIADAFVAACPQADVARVRLTTRLAVEMGAAALDLLFDAPELELTAVSATLAEMLGREMLALRRG